MGSQQPGVRGSFGLARALKPFTAWGTALLCSGLLLAALHSGAARAQGAIPAPRDVPYPGTIELHVDATDLDRRMFQVRQRMPVQPGALVLHFPRFLPGTHGPYGAIERLAGLRMKASGRELDWQRDTVEPFTFHVQIPDGTTQLELEFQFLAPTAREGGRALITREMLNLQWNSTVLYPAAHAAGSIAVQASVKLPEAWEQASALRVDRVEGSTVRFKPVSLETLVDSPIFAGLHVKRIALDPPGTARPVTLNLVADQADQLKASDEQIEAHRELVRQSDRLFASRHFGHYQFLLALSDHLGGIGLEHHESSENGVKPDYFKDWAKRIGSRELLPHEYVHSWNGKFRRPADLWTPHYNVPMRNSLLWLYEGQTQFWGKALAARSGLVTMEQARYGLARLAAMAQHRSGRLWRNLQDTTNQGTMAPRQANDWRSWQRGVDYYDEAVLIWLDADTVIREKSGGQRSMDDFARLFFGVQDGRIEPLTYTFDDVVATLQQVQPHDWRQFLRERLDGKTAAPLEGLQRAGWRLGWSETESEFARNANPDFRFDDFAYSLGLLMKKDGGIEEVLWDSPAFKAGFSRALQLVAVNGTAYKAERLAEAVSANKDGSRPLQLLVREGERYRSITIDYRGGLRYPQLVRIDGTPDLLTEGLFKRRP